MAARKNYSFEKNQRARAKAAKREAKREQKLAKKRAEDAGEDGSDAPAHDGDGSPETDDATTAGADTTSGGAG